MSVENSLQEFTNNVHSIIYKNVHSIIYKNAHSSEKGKKKRHKLGLISFVRIL